jgi:hypothetical protein
MHALHQPDPDVTNQSFFLKYIPVDKLLKAAQCYMPTTALRRRGEPPVC